jgi:hypothetical protein
VPAGSAALFRRNIVIDWVLNFRFNSLIGILMYWMPATFCVVFYTLRSANEFQHDFKARDKVEKGTQRESYYPTITIGSLIGRGIASLIPVVNIWCALFDLAPQVFSHFFKWIGRVFDQPLVPKRQTK